MLRLVWILAVFFAVLTLLGSVQANAASSEAQERYEYKIVSLGSLSALQKGDSGPKLAEVEKILNEQGLDGWEMVNIFAVRTTFDPNVFFVAMKRPILNSAQDGD
jgi:hypothetical protein